MPHSMYLAAAGAALLALVPPADAQDLVLSVRDNVEAVLGGVAILDGDAVRYDPISMSGSILLAESAFTTGSIDLNAFHVRADGTYLLSTLFNAEIGGLVFGDGDVVLYDPVRGTASMFLPETTWTGTTTSTDVNAIYEAPDGALVLSHINTTDTIGGIPFTDGDIIGFDPGTGVATLLVAESVLIDDGDGDIDALHVLDDGRYLVSFQDDEMISGVSVADGSVVAYDASKDTAEIYFDETTFDNQAVGNDTNAFSIIADAPCAEDLDGSGSVDFGDLLRVLSTWGACTCPEDLDGSGAVDFGDLLRVLSNWGPCANALGPCCLCDGTCQDVTLDDCTAADGFWQDAPLGAFRNVPGPATIFPSSVRNVISPSST